VADTPEERNLGLMFRRSLPESRGMLFVFEKTNRQIFWMKDTPLPLSIAFLDEDGRVLGLADMEALDQARYHASPPKTRYAVEANRGWFQRKGIRPGDTAQIKL